MNDCNSTYLISSDNPLFYELQDEEEALSPVKTRFTKYQLFCNTYFRLFSQEKEEEAWNFCWKHWRPTKVHGRPQEGVLHAAQQILPDHQKKLALVLLSGASFSFFQTSLLSQKMLIRFGKKHFDFLEECVMLPKQKMELALKISQNPKKFWIIKPPGWSFICGVKILKVFSAEAPMQILHCVTQSCSYSYFSSIFFSQIYE